MSDDTDISLPSIDDLKAEISVGGQVAKTNEDEFETKFRRLSIDAELQYAHLDGLRDHYKHKGKWSYFLIFLMFMMVAFQCLLLWRVGIGAWDFTKYQWLLPALLVQNLTQVVGLAVFVVKALFKDLK